MNFSQKSLWTSFLVISLFFKYFEYFEYFEFFEFQKIQNIKKN